MSRSRKYKKANGSVLGGHEVISDEVGYKPRVMPFGKYKGQKIKSLPIDYCEWLVASMSTSPSQSKSLLYQVILARVLDQKNGI